MKKTLQITIVGFYLLLAAIYVLEPFPTDAIAETLYLLFPIISFGLSVYAVRGFGLKSETGRALAVTSSGLFSWMIGEFAWYWYRVILGVSPSPSIADAFFLVGYPLLLAGIYMQFKIMNISWKDVGKYAITANILVFGALSSLVVYFGIYLGYIKGDAGLGSVIDSLNSIGDLALILASFFALYLAYSCRGGKFSFFWLYMSAGFVFWFIADLFLTIFRVQYTSGLHPYEYIDLLWLLGHVFMALGMLYYGATINAAVKKAQNAISVFSGK